MKTRRYVRALFGIALVVVVAIVAVVTWRMTSLRSLPDIGEPFDVEAFSSVSIPDDENAFVLYRLAVAKYRPFDPASPPSADWSTATARDRQWLESNREALELWKQGTDREAALNISPDELNFDTNIDVLQGLRRLTQLAGLEGTRLEAEGDMAGAWTWYRATLRESRHCGQRGILIERLVGISMHAAACSKLSDWSMNPKLDPALLRTALAEFQQIDLMTPPTSDCIKAEYLGFVHTLDRPDMIRRFLASSVAVQDESRSRDLKAKWLGLRATLLREPERSRRVFRLIVANWLAYCDLPKSKRPALVDQAGSSYAEGESSDPDAHRLTPDQLTSWFESTILIKIFLPGFRPALVAIDRERSTYDTLLLQMTRTLYEREHGKTPDTDEELVGRYLRVLPDSRRSAISADR